MATPLNFEDWYDKNEQHLTELYAETGMDREYDWNPADEDEHQYDQYCESFEPEITDKELARLDELGNLWELGHELNDQLQSELNHTYWTLSDMSCQVRALNQVSIDIETLQSEIFILTE